MQISDNKFLIYFIFNTTDALQAAVSDLILVLAIYAFCAITGAILDLKLPESKGLEIPDTIEEAENLAKKKSMNKYDDTVI